MDLYPGVKENILMSEFSTTGVGGPARYFYHATSRTDLLGVLDWAEKEGIYYVVIGHGSNLLVPDSGYAGLIVRNEVVGFALEEVKTGQSLVTVEAGMPLLLLISQLAELGWGGFENLAGVPGTVGGAVWGNSSCYGISTSDVIHSALVRKNGGDLVTIPVSEMGYKYRHSMLSSHPYWVVIAATYKAKRVNACQSRNQIRYILNKRHEEKPVGKSCGSYFKNPTSDSSAGFLIDHAGLKGFKVGDVRVSDQHANFLINDGCGTCKDVLELADEIKRRVYEQYRIKLEEEVVLLAEKPDAAANRMFGAERLYSESKAKFC